MKYQTTQFFEPWERDFFQFFDNILGIDQARESRTPAFTKTKKRFAPLVDVTESESAYQYFIDLPGMKKEDIMIEIKENNLHVWGEKKSDHAGLDQDPQNPMAKAQSQSKRLYSERLYGEFYRVLPLDVKSKIDQIDAHYEQGLLTITIPKGETPQIKKISIQGN